MKSGLVAAALVLVVLCAAAARAESEVDLELVLAVDASRSIDAYEYGLQRQGYAQALTDPALIRAITSGPTGRIALAYVEWSSIGEQATLVDWTIVDGAAAAARFAEALIAAPRRHMGPTAVGDAIDYAVRMFDGNGIVGLRRVIDVSGDGPNNRGRPSFAARDQAVAAGIVINGLAIVNDRPSRPPWPEEPVDKHYREQVIGGPGAFMMVVEGFEDFAAGIRAKLIREVAGHPTGPPDRTAQSRSSSLIEVLARVRSSTRLTMTAQ